MIDIWNILSGIRGRNAVKKELCSNTYRFKILQLFRLRQMFVMVSPQMILCTVLTYTTYLNFERRTVWLLCMVLQVTEKPFQKTPSPKYS